jgi:hypothetical protein
MGDLEYMIMMLERGKPIVIGDGGRGWRFKYNQVQYNQSSKGC